LSIMASILLNFHTTTAFIVTTKPLSSRRITTRLRITPKEEEETLLKVWSSRRSLIRSTLASSHTERDKALSQDAVEGEDPVSQAVIYTTFAAVFSSILIRVGGRSALIGGLGLAPPSDLPDGGFVGNVLEGIQNLSVTPGDPSTYLFAFVSLLPFWLTARVLMIDYLAIPLALLSGVIFKDVLVGGVASSVLSTTGSLCGFLIGRYSPVGEKVLRKITDANPVVKAVGKTVEMNPVKSVLVARLAPVLPIPIGAYNYVYGGLTTVPIPKFMLGIFLGGLKPYLLDSYLGTLGFSLAGGGGGEVDDWVIILVLSAAVGVGALATTLAQEGWEEVKVEIEMEEMERLRNGGVEEEEKYWFGIEPPEVWKTLCRIFSEAESDIRSVVQYEYSLGLYKILQEEGKADEDVEKELERLGIDFRKIKGMPESRGKLDLTRMTIESIAFTSVLGKEWSERSDPKKDVDGTYKQLLLPF